MVDTQSNTALQESKPHILHIPKFTITKKEIFLLAAALLILFSLVLQIPISVFNAYDLLLITILTFLAKGFFQDTKDTPLYFIFTLGIFFTLYYPIFQVLLIYLITIALFKVIKVI
jgi:hypothetical protein